MAELAARLLEVGDDPKLREKAMGRYLSRKARLMGVPLSGSFELTPLCNLDCKMCYAHLSPSQMDRPLLTGAQWIAIIDQAVEAGMMYAQLTGGECLTHPDFKAIYLHLRDRGVLTVVLTNATLIDEGWADFFGTHPPLSVQVSLYGSDEEGYRRVTGHRAFQRTVDGIRRLKDRGIDVDLTVMISRYLQEDALNIFDLAQKMRLPFHYAVDVNTPRADTGRGEENHNAQLEHIVDLKRRLDARIGARTAPTTMDVLLHEGPRLDQDAGMPCGCGRSSFHIEWRGDMIGCPVAAKPKAPAFSFAKAWAQVGDWAFRFRAAQRCEGCEHEKLCGAMHCPLYVEYSFTKDGQSALCHMARLMNTKEA